MDMTLLLAVVVILHTIIVIVFLSMLEKSRRRHMDMWFSAIATKLGVQVREASTPRSSVSGSTPHAPAPPSVSPDELIEKMLNPTEADLYQQYEELKKHPQFAHLWESWDEES